MKKAIVFMVLCLAVAVNLLPVENVETILIKGEKDYLEMLADNEVYCKLIADMEYLDGSLFLLDEQLCLIFRVDLETGKLLKKYFRRGQGPMELMQPMSLKIMNGKIFVLDRGFGGIKICDLEGSPVNEFKTLGVVGKRNIDVNDKDEIFVSEYSTKENTFVSVYTLKGEKIRSLVKIGSDSQLDLQRTSYQIRLDYEGNILVLFTVLREIMKFDSTGKMLWEKKIKNKVLDRKEDNDDGVKLSPSGAMNTRISVFGFNVTKNNNIVIGHAYGGCIFDKNGQLTNLITFEPDHALFLFEITGDHIINGFGPKILTLFEIKEGIIK